MNTSQRLALKRLATGIYRAVPRERPRRIVISYHAVGSGPWSTPDTQFRKQIEWLSAHVRLRSLDDMVNEPPTSDDLQVAVTFDDGYQSVLTRAAPPLEQAGASPTLFISTSRIADRVRTVSDEAQGYYRNESFLLWSEVADLRARGWRIESHGSEHPDLAQESEQSVRDQLTHSKQLIEERLAAPCVGFAYPFGRSSSRVQALAAECGYQWAVCSTHGTVKKSVDRYAIPRIDIRNNYTIQDFIAVVRGDWDYLHLVQAARHRFRFYR